MMYQIYKKSKKLIKIPGVFFRDYFNKRYPIINNEQKILQDDEEVVVKYTLQQYELESRLRNNNFAVDVVFTWVDDTDEMWRKKYQIANKQSLDGVGLYSKDKARFENHNELYYSVHSVLKNLQWVNHIFIVTASQTPAWFRELNNDKITIIDHEQIIDKQYLPTFNSHVIEANLHRIPNLSENFIYFNDDVFVARPLPKEHFFSGNGNASIFFADKSLAQMKRKGMMTPTLFACSNCQVLLNKTYGLDVDIPLVHTYFPLKKTCYERVWQLYENDIKLFLSNKFRGDNDLNLATFLVPYLMYLDGHSSSKTEICYYFNIRTNHAKLQYKKLLIKKHKGGLPHSFCANDFNSKKSVSNFYEDLENFLKEYFDIN